MLLDLKHVRIASSVMTNNWLNEKKYLPDFLVDHSDRYAVSAVIYDEIATQVQAYKTDGYSHLLDGVDAIQVGALLVDHILPFMARHGYTLQRTRIKGVGFDDIGTTIASANERATDQRSELLKDILGDDV